MHRLVARCRPLYGQPEFRVLLALNLVLGLAYSFVMPFVSMFGTIEVGMTTMTFGVFMTVVAVANIFYGTTLAHYSDRIASRRGLLLLGSIFGGLGHLGYAFVRDIPSLFLIGSLVLAVSSVTFSQLFAQAREAIARSPLPPTESAFYMNAFRMFFALSWTIGPAIASWVLKLYSFEGLFVSAAVCFFLFAAITWFALPKTPPARPKSAHADESVLKVLARGDVAAHFAGFVLIFASGTIGMMNLPLLVLMSLGGNPHDIAIIYSIAPVFELPLMLYFGLLATRRDPASVIRLGAIVAVVYYGFLSIVQAPWHVYVLQILSAAITSVTSGVAITYFQNYLPNHPGTATNLYATASRIGSTVGYLLFGTLAAHFAHRTVFVTCAVFAAITLALLHVSPRTRNVDTGATSA